jgi:nucleoside-diphosphate-sugar epimerase
VSEENAALVRSDCREVLGSGRRDLLETLRGTRVLVVGGTGFMGLWLAEAVACLNDDHDFGISLVLASRHAEALAARAPHLAARSDIEALEADARDLTVLPRVDHLVNAAATPDNRVHASDPIGVSDTIARGTSTLLRAAYDLPDLRSFLQVSSGLVYGPQPLEMPGLAEGHVGGPSCDSIVSVYAEAKRFAEAECAAWGSLYKLPIVTARPFAFIGPYQALDKPWAVNNFMRDMLAGTPIRILGDGDTIRSYMYGSDMAFWLLRIIAAGVPGNAYNVGSPHAITLADLAEHVAALGEPRPEIVSRSGGAREPSRFVPDTAKASSALGLSVTVDLDDALARTARWHRGRKPGA